MTASLPVPHEPSPDDPDDADARAADGEVVDFATGPRPASGGSGRSPSPRKKKPAKPRAARTRTPGVAPDPGPPPPLPPADDIIVPPRPDLPAATGDDIVVPPRPPLPATPDDAAATEADTPGPPAPEAGISDATDADTPDAEIPDAESRDADDPAEAVEVEGTVTVESDLEVIADTDSVLQDLLDGDSAAPTPDSDLDSAEALTPPRADGVTGADVEIASAAMLADVFFGARELSEVDEESAALVLRGVSKRFGDTTAVEAIDLTVPAGSFYGLVGPNGAGKTTTLSMIAGLLAPDRGVIRVGGLDAASDPRGTKKLMGVLPDRLRTFDRLTGRQLLYYYGVLRGLKPAVVESRTADLARAFDLTDALGRTVSDYSAGMTKKVMLAGAMIHSPRVLVLDEPFESVDPVSSAVILDILSAYVEHGGTVILSSHGMELVERVCSRVAVIVSGQVLAEGTVEEVRGELTLEQRFIELAGGLGDVEGLEWLHTFSD